MPGPTAKTNPWADELKKSRRRSRKGLSSVSGKDPGLSLTGEAEAAAAVSAKTNLSETKESVLDREKASLVGDEIVGCKTNWAKAEKNSSPGQGRPPKVKPPSLPVDEDSRSLYQDARSQLRPVARMLSQ